MNVKDVVFGVVIGVVVVVVAGFNYFGWQLSSTSAEHAKVAMKQSAVCVAEFVKSPNYPARLKEFSGKYPFEYSAYIDKEGWGKSAAQTFFPANEACAEGISVLVGPKPAAQ